MSVIVHTPVRDSDCYVHVDTRTISVESDSHDRSWVACVCGKPDTDCRRAAHLETNAVFDGSSLRPRDEPGAVFHDTLRKDTDVAVALAVAAQRTVTTSWIDYSMRVNGDPDGRLWIETHHTSDGIDYRSTVNVAGHNAFPKLVGSIVGRLFEHPERFDELTTAAWDYLARARQRTGIVDRYEDFAPQDLLPYGRGSFLIRLDERPDPVGLTSMPENAIARLGRYIVHSRYAH